jgi:hypothetical protein
MFAIAPTFTKVDYQYNKIIELFSLVPLILYQQNVLQIMCDQFKLTMPQPNQTELNIGRWKKLSKM